MSGHRPREVTPMYDQTQYVITFTADAEVTPAPKEEEQ